MITQTLAMIQALVYCLAVYFKVIVFWHIAVLAFMLGCIDTLNQTVRQSLVNGMVPKEELLNAIGLQSSFFNLSKILGPSAGGAIIALVGISGCFFLNALSFMALIWNLYLMKLRLGNRQPTNKHCGKRSKKVTAICAAIGGFFRLCLFPTSSRWWALPTRDFFPCSRPIFCASDRRGSGC